MSEDDFKKNDTPIYDSVSNPKPEEKASLTPVPKVAAAGIAGAVTVLLVFVVQAIWPNFDIPSEVSAALTAIIAFAAGYMKRS